MSTICVFGDSITWGAYDYEKGGWVERLKVFMAENSDNDVYNLGVSGNKTPHILSRVESETKVRTEEAEDIVLIFAVGINDSYFVHSENRLMTPPEEFKTNIEKTIERAQVITSKIIFVGLTPVDETKTTPIPWNTDKSFKNEYIQKYNNFISSICKDKNIYFVEILDKWLQSDYQDLLEDGLHPNSKGHQKIFEAVRDFLTQNKIIKI